MIDDEDHPIPGAQAFSRFLAQLMILTGAGMLLTAAFAPTLLPGVGP